MSFLEQEMAYADCSSDTLVLLNLLAFLDLCACIITNELHAHILLTATELRRIDGNEESLDTTLFRVLNVLTRDLAVTVDVELDEEVLAWCSIVDDVVE